jgi:hypothetical protein
MNAKNIQHTVTKTAFFIFKLLLSFCFFFQKGQARGLAPTIMILIATSSLKCKIFLSEIGDPKAETGKRCYGVLK